jgi:putative transcriptional regulator
MVSIQESLKGHYLIAMPGMKDPNFHQTVTVICEHSAEGAIGIIINRVHEHLMCSEIFEELNIDYEPISSAARVYFGGPVHMGEIFMLHGPPFTWESCLLVSPTLAMSNSRDIIEAVALNRGPEAFILSLGCAGWGPGQLEAEMLENAWLTCPAIDEVIFRCPVENRWHAAVKKMGFDPMWLSSTSGIA